MSILSAVDGVASSRRNLCGIHANNQLLFRCNVRWTRPTLYSGWATWNPSVINFFIGGIHFQLGRNSSINEPWPDVLGVVIVFIISGMFILGLENSKVFSVLMITGVLSISGLLAVVTYLRGNIETWTHDTLFPKGLPGVRLMSDKYVSLSLC